MFIPSGIRGLEEVIPGLPKQGLIIVAGNPGTGKTIFSAAFIYSGIVNYGEKGVYASLAEDKETFYQNMKELGYDFESLEKKGMFKFLNFITLLEEGASSIVNEILNVVEVMGAKRLVIDSFSAIAQGFRDPREVRVFLHTFLSRIVKSLGCTAILIEEIPFGKEEIGYGFEEFVADALLIFKTLEVEGKLVREMRIAKLRGAAVYNPEICFTLHGGFKVTPPFKVIESKETRRYKPLPDPPNGYSTGSPDLDKAIGGYPKGSTILLEMDPRIQNHHYRLIARPTAANFLLKGRPVILIPSAGATWEEFVNDMKLFGVSEDEINQLVRIIVAKERVDEQNPPCVVPYEPTNLEESYRLFLKIEEELVRKSGKPALKIIGMDMIAHYFGEEGAVTLGNLEVSREKYAGGLSLWFGKPIYPEVVKKAIPLSSMHLKLTRRHGCFLLYGMKPRTPLYAVEMDVSNGYPLPKLTPMI